MINLDDVQDGTRELERAARLGLSGAMITEYPLEDRRYDQSEYESFWAAAAALDMPLSLHTATRRQGRIRGAGDKTLRDASSRATKAFYPALSLCDLIFSGVFERHPRLGMAIVEFEWLTPATWGRLFQRVAELPARDDEHCEVRARRSAQFPHQRLDWLEVCLVSRRPGGNWV